VVAGLAGAGKTALLEGLAAAGEQVLDLEGLASHRGSAFGAIGLPAQPSHAEFGRRVGAVVAAADPARPLFVEDEGPFIGSVGVPAWLQRATAAAPAIELRAPFADRVARLTATYGSAPAEQLVAALQRSRRRLGAPVADRAAALVTRGDVEAAIALVLPVFDAAYEHRMAARR
jgi:tRNA 2-selenouridine synthase